MYIRARFTAVYAYMCNFSGMYVELVYIRGNDTTGCTQVILRHNRVLLFVQLKWAQLIGRRSFSPSRDGKWPGCTLLCRFPFILCMAITTGQGRQSCSRSASWTGKMNYSLTPFAPENFWSRETGSAVPSRISLLISILQAESSASACLRDFSWVPLRRPFIIGKH